MYRNKNNGKIIKDAVFKKGTVYFTIDGLKESLPLEIFAHNYEVVNEQGS